MIDVRSDLVWMTRFGSVSQFYYGRIWCCWGDQVEGIGVASSTLVTATLGVILGHAKLFVFESELFMLFLGYPRYGYTLTGLDVTERAWS